MFGTWPPGLAPSLWLERRPLLVPTSPCGIRLPGHGKTATRSERCRAAGTETPRRRCHRRWAPSVPRGSAPAAPSAQDAAAPTSRHRGGPPGGSGRSRERRVSGRIGLRPQGVERMGSGAGRCASSAGAPRIAWRLSVCASASVSASASQNVATRCGGLPRAGASRRGWPPLGARRRPPCPGWDVPPDGLRDQLYNMQSRLKNSKKTPALEGAPCNDSAASMPVEEP